jgi:hypothetical protein
MPEAYPVFEDVVKKILMEALKGGENEELLRRLFGFFEDMANAVDPEVPNLLWIAIIEPLVYNKESSQRAWQYMGKKTKELAREEAALQNRPGSIPQD